MSMRKNVIITENLCCNEITKDNKMISKDQSCKDCLAYLNFIADDCDPYPSCCEDCMHNSDWDNIEYEEDFDD